MGRKQKVRNPGEGWEDFVHCLCPCVLERLPQLPEMKRQRLLRRLFVKQKDRFASFLKLNVLEAKLFLCVFLKDTVNV